MAGGEQLPHCLPKRTHFLTTFAKFRLKCWVMIIVLFLFLSHVPARFLEQKSVDPPIFSMIDIACATGSSWCVLYADWTICLAVSCMRVIQSTDWRSLGNPRPTYRCQKQSKILRYRSRRLRHMYSQRCVEVMLPITEESNSHLLEMEYEVDGDAIPIF